LFHRNGLRVAGWGAAIRETVVGTQRKKGRDVILYGAGAAGVTLLRE